MTKVLYVWLNAGNSGYQEGRFMHPAADGGFRGKLSLPIHLCLTVGKYTKARKGFVAFSTNLVDNFQNENIFSNITEISINSQTEV